MTPPANTKKCQCVITAVSGYGKEGKEGKEGEGVRGKEGQGSSNIATPTRLE